RRALSLLFQENETTLPQWLLEPFFDSAARKHAVNIISAKDARSDDIAYKTVQDVAFMIKRLAKFPGSMNANDTKQAYDHRLDREKRVIPLLTTDDGSVVARLDIHAGGSHKHASIATFGLNPQSIVMQPQLRNTLVGVADYILHTPRVLKTTINTTIQKNNESVVPKFIITLQNPTAKTVKGKLSLHIAGIPQKKVDVEISPG